MTDRPPAPEPLPHPVVDNHCHLDMGRGGDAALPLEEALAAAAAVGVPRIVQIGCDLPGARWAVEAAASYDALVVIPCCYWSAAAAASMSAVARFVSSASVYAGVNNSLPNPKPSAPDASHSAMSCEPMPPTG